MTPVKHLLCQVPTGDVARILISTADSQLAALILPRLRAQQYSMVEMLDLLSGEKIRIIMDINMAFPCCTNPNSSTVRRAIHVYLWKFTTMRQQKPQFLIFGVQVTGLHLLPLFSAQLHQRLQQLVSVSFRMC